jgi:hypothetical protein
MPDVIVKDNDLILLHSMLQIQPVKVSNQLPTVTLPLCDFFARYLIMLWTDRKNQSSYCIASNLKELSIKSHGNVNPTIHNNDISTENDFNVEILKRKIFHIIKTTSISMSIVLIALNILHRINQKQSFPHLESDMSQKPVSDVLRKSSPFVAFVAALVISMKGPNGCCNTFTNKVFLFVHLFL